MGFDDAYQLGYVKKTHGLKGQVILALDVDDPLHYDRLESVFLNQNGALIPFFIDSINIRGTEAMVKLEDFESIDEAAPLVGTEVWLPLEQLPELPKGAFYYHDLVGYDVFDHDQLLGQVVIIYSLPNNVLLGVEHHQAKKEILIPTKDEVTHQFDHVNKRILSTLPDGLVDLYLNEE